MASKEIINALMTEDLYEAKKLINNELMTRMGAALEEKLINFGPSIFNEGKKPDFLDLDGDGDKSEPMKKAAKEAKGMKKEDIEFANEFEANLRSLVEDIENELGTELTEEEVQDIASDLLDAMSDSSDDQDLDQNGDEDQYEYDGDDTYSDDDRQN